MYIDNININYVTNENNVYATQNQPVKNTEEENNIFKEILTDTIQEASSQYQISAETTTTQANEVASNNVNTIPPMDSVPPVIKTQETAASFYVSKYYPIQESEVIAKIREVRYIINNADLTGNNDIEKYDFIENRFIDAFGKDFMIARNLNLPSSMFYMVGIEFNDTLNKHIENPEQTNRTRLYGNASADEIQNSIRSKYPDDLSNRDLMLKVNEMRNAGVLDNASLNSLSTSGANRIMDTLSLVKNYARFNAREFDYEFSPMSLEDREKQWINMMNNKVYRNDLLYMYNIWAESGKVSMGNDTAPFLVKYMDGELDEFGLFKLPGSGSQNWEYILNLFLSEMDEYENLIRSRMMEIDAEEYIGAVENQITGEYIGPGENQIIGEGLGAEENLDIEEVNDHPADGSSENNSEVVESNPEVAESTPEAA